MQGWCKAACEQNVGQTSLEEGRGREGSYVGGWIAGCCGFCATTQLLDRGSCCTAVLGRKAQLSLPKTGKKMPSQLRSLKHELRPPASSELPARLVADNSLQMGSVTAKGEQPVEPTRV